MLDREHELARIETALESACAGVGSAVVLEGEAGIGKSALVAAARTAAEVRGMRALAARGSELETEYPFGLVRQCLEPLVRGSSADDRQELFFGAAALAAPVLLDAPSENVPASFGVLHGLYWLVATLADRTPLLIAFDDVHWSDQPSLQFLTYLVHRIDSLPVTVISATRPVASLAVGSEALADLLSLQPLGEAAVAAVLQDSGAGQVDELFARACHHATGGNPFLLTELVRTLREEQVPFTVRGVEQVGELTPPQVARITRARLAHLDPPATALARALVVLGDDTPLDLLSELGRIGTDAAAEAADALVAAGLVDGGTRLRFRHPLLRSAVAASLTLSERERYHGDAAELLRGRHAPPERVAVHLLATAPSGSDADRRTLHDAAARTVERGAPAAAVPLFGRLLDEPLSQAERATVLLELGQAEYAAGLLDAAAEHLEEAHHGAGDPITAARALAQLLQATSVRTRGLEQLANAAESLIETIQQHDREAALRLQAQTILIPRAHAATDERLAQLARLPGTTPGEAVVLGHLIFRRISTGASAAEIADLAERAARQVDAIVEDGTTTTAFTGVILGLRWSDRLDAADRFVDRAIAIARRRGSTIDFANCHGLRGEVYVRRGLLREGEADGRVAQAAELFPSWWFARGLNPLLQSLVLQGRAGEAAEILAAELGDEILPDVPPMISLMLTRAQIRAALGDHAGAIAEFEEAVRRREKWGGVTPSWIGDILIAADSRTSLGDHDAADSLRAEARVLADRWGTPGMLGQVRRAEALAASGSAQVEGLREAVALLERSPARLELARALVDVGAALRRAGHRGDARIPLGEGYDLGRECGADALAETARLELAASGMRIRRERLTGVESLTPSERRIADMAAAGSSNAEIAQALFVTVKTVEMHLTRIYRKLEISGRSALVPALQRRG